jgi:hypothetical protein
MSGEAIWYINGALFACLNVLISFEHDVFNSLKLLVWFALLP